MASKLFPRNEGNVDRVLRVVVGAVLISLVFIGPKTAWGWIGLVPFVTGLLGTCPVYTLFDMRTCPMKETSDGH